MEEWLPDAEHARHRDAIELARPHEIDAARGLLTRRVTAVPHERMLARGRGLPGPPPNHPAVDVHDLDRDVSRPCHADGEIGALAEWIRVHRPERDRGLRGRRLDSRRDRGRGRRVDHEHRIDARRVTVERDPDLDLGEQVVRGPEDPAVEVLDGAAVHGQIERHLVLNGDLPAEAVGTGAGDGEVRGGARHGPADIQDTVLIEERTRCERFEQEGPPERLGDDGAVAQGEAPGFEPARIGELVGLGDPGLGGRGHRAEDREERKDTHHEAPHAIRVHL